MACATSTCRRPPRPSGKPFRTPRGRGFRLAHTLSNRLTLVVMAGLGPAISLRKARLRQTQRDHRDKPGDDGGERLVFIPLDRNRLYTEHQSEGMTTWQTETLSASCISN